MTMLCMGSHSTVDVKIIHVMSIVCWSNLVNILMTSGVKLIMHNLGKSLT